MITTSSVQTETERDDDEIELLWAAIERLPTMKRVRMSLFDNQMQEISKQLEQGFDEKKKKRIIDVTKLTTHEKHVFIDKLVHDVQEDNARLLLKMKQRMDKVGVKLPAVEVRFNNLSVEAKCEVVHGKPLPTLWNTFKSIISTVNMPCCKSQEATLSIIKGVSGTIRPSRMTLLIGPPGAGKSTLLKALAGKLDKSLKVRGEIYYNDTKLEDLRPQEASAYISQYSLHTPEMTVRETMNFSARCQGVESRKELLVEISRREKQAGIVPEPDIDTYMKAISINGLERTLQTDYVLKILGLEICADTFVGNAMRRGISGGQKRRLTTAEMMVTARRVLFMDEISNGLDSSTTFQVVNCLQQVVHITDLTALISLLQPAPEIFDLFDDIILFVEGKIVYNGPRSDVLSFFEGCGFRCPDRKGVADFIQEVTSRNDQGQYWYNSEVPYRYITVDEFARKFRASHIGERQGWKDEELRKTSGDSHSNKNPVSKYNRSTYSMTKWELFKACMDREVLLTRRNISYNIVKSTQLTILACIAMTTYIRTRMDVDLKHSNYYMGCMFFGIMRIVTNGITEMFMTLPKLAVFYKERAYNFYPAWAYAIPASLIKIPFSLVDAFLWTALTYYIVGFSPEIERFFCQFLLLFTLNQAISSLFRMLASVCRVAALAEFFTTVLMVAMLFFGGFIVPKRSLPAGLQWGFWLSPVTYAEIGMSLNEFLAPRWGKVTLGNLTIGQETLSNYGLDFRSYYYWICVGALVGFTVIFNAVFTLALTYLNSPGTARAIISYDKLRELQREDSEDGDKKFMASQPHYSGNGVIPVIQEPRKMVLPFEPLTLTFENAQYFIDTPQQMRKNGFKDKRLQLLHDMTGAFRPGILTALMGVTGAGKTTLMDVLSGRKNSGYIEGDIRIGGFPKVQQTFARISGYCEQTDIHSPYVTVEESIVFSSWLRLPPNIDTDTRNKFIRDVLETVELDGIQSYLVGIPGVSGLSTEQRKRLTIAVELVSNPAIIFMDEPTSGLDARAAAIVMRAVKNVADTGRTVVCTIHQPSIDIFEAFDELILMKKGGKLIYSGQLGQNSTELTNYFQSIPGIPKIKENYNPATWVLELSAGSTEALLGIDFSQVYKESQLHRDNAERVKQLAKPPPDTRALHYPTRFPRNAWEQYKACLWKQNMSYWRNPAYNLKRLGVVAFTSVLMGAVLWQKGTNIHDMQDLSNILSSIFISLQLIGANNCSAVIPVVVAERTVLYREIFSAMYSAWAYSFAQVSAELPYLFVQSLLFLILTYPAVGFYWSIEKVVFYFLSTLCASLYYTYHGMLIVSISPDGYVAQTIASTTYALLNLFSGYIIPRPAIPKWWVWLYWISPSAWLLNSYITSQYGDIKQQINSFGKSEAINSFLEDYYGYNHDRLGLVAVVTATFPLIAVVLFACFIRMLNFQRR